MEKTFMRRGLSFLLALALVAGIMPAGTFSVASAADDLSVTYDFKYYGDKTSGTEMFFTTKGVSGLKYTNNQSGCGYWEYLNHNIFSTNTDLSTPVNRDSNFKRYTINGDANVYFQGGYDSSGYGAWVAFKVKGLSNGLYDVSMNTFHYANKTTKVGLYLLPGSAIDASSQGNTLNNIHGVVKYNTSDTELHAEAIARFPEAKLIGSKKSLDGSAVWKELNLGKVSVTGGTEETEYVLVIKVEEPTPVTAAGSQPLDTLFFPEITFEYQHELSAAEISFDDAVLGEKIEPEVKLINVAGKEFTSDKYTVKLTSSDTSKVMIAADGSAYAVGEGTTEIKAEVTYNGETAEAAAEVTVVAPPALSGKNQSYNFWTGAYEDTDIQAVLKADGTVTEKYTEYGEAGRPWRYLDSTSTNVSSAGNILSMTSAYLAMNNSAGQWTAWNVKVPAAGRYSVDFSGYCYAGGGVAEVYMTPYTEGMTREDIVSAITPGNLVGTMDEARPSGHAEFGKVVTETIGIFDAEDYEEYLMVVRGVNSQNANKAPYIHMASVSLYGESAPITSVSTKLYDTELGAGEKTQVAQTVCMDAAGDAVSMSNGHIEYFTADSEIAEYNAETGEITAVAEGETRLITVAIKNGFLVKTETPISVSADYAVDGIEVFGNTQAPVGTVFKIGAEIKLANGDAVISKRANPVFTEVSDPEDAVTIENNVIKANSVGSATVKVSAEYRGVEVENTVELTVSEEYTALSGEKLFFDFGVGDFAADKGKDIYTYTDYAENRNWAYVSDYVTGADSSGASISLLKDMIQCASNSVGEYMAFKVNIPAPGRYQTIYNSYIYSPGGIADIYAIPYSDDAAANVSEYLVDAYKLGSADCYNATAEYKDFLLDDVEFTQAGEYIIAMYVSGKNSAASDYAMYPASLTLDGVNVISKAEMTADISRLGVNEQGSFTVTAKMSDNADVPMDMAKITCTSDNSEIVSVDGESLTFKALKDGTATITVAVSYKGVTVTDNHEIVVDTSKYAVKNVLLYGKETASVGDVVVYTPALELNNGAVVEVVNGEVEYFVKYQSPENTVSVDGVKILANSVGTADIYAEVKIRGNEYTSETVTLNVVEAAEGDFVIDFRKGAYTGDPEGDVELLTEYTPYRRWVYVGNQGQSTDPRNQTIMNSAVLSQMVFDKNYNGVWYMAIKAKVPAAGTYAVSINAYCSSAGALSELYIFPATEESRNNIEANLVAGNRVGEFDFYSTGGSYVTDTYGTVTFEGAGEYMIVFKGLRNGGAGANSQAIYPVYLSFGDVKSYGTAQLTAEKTTLEIGETVSSRLTLLSIDGNEIPYEVSDFERLAYESSDTSVATVSATGEITAVSEGKATIEVYTVFDGIEKKGYLTVTVRDDTELTGAAITGKNSIYIYGSQQLEVYTEMSSGNSFKIPSEYVTWKLLDTSDPGVAELSDTGIITGKALGSVHVQAIIDPSYKPLADNITVAPFTVNIVWDATVNPAIYTVEERENAKINAARYSWAKSEVETAKKNADKYVEKMETIYNLMVPEGLPRYYHVAHKMDPLKFYCRYCGCNIGLEYGSYAWVTDPLNSPWKIQCPDCRRKFPSNDFGSFYALGITETGGWSYEQAKAKNAELEADPNHGGYLKNELYPEMDKKLGVENWGVDDGFGYKQPYISDPTLPGYDARYWNNNGLAYFSDSGTTGPVEHKYIAYYLHEGIWYGQGSTANNAVVRKAINSLATAFVYTGEAKYGRAGAILLDRAADFYPDFDWYRWAEFRGDSYKGKMVDATWQTFIDTEFAEAYDAFLPIYNDSYVVEFLSKNGVKYAEGENGEPVVVNAKDSPGALRKNVEDGYLREIYKGAVNGNLRGNFGMEQETVTTAAVAFNRLPETGEWLEWVMAPDRAKDVDQSAATYTGGHVLPRIMNKVDRDGYGNEAAPGYNSLWPDNLMGIADKLKDYELYPMVDLFENAKFVKMLTVNADLEFGGYYTAQVGDSGAAGSTGLGMYLDTMLTGFKHTGSRKLAQAIYRYNEYYYPGTTDKLRGSILDADPEGLIDQILDIVEEDGEYPCESNMLTGYGMAALRDGAKYSTSIATNEVNNIRDFGIYFGLGLGHGHKDALNMYMSAFGLNMAPDLGYPEDTSTSSNRVHWVNGTISHNTVVVNEKSQTGNSVSGKPNHFDDAGRVKLMDISNNHAYDEVEEYRRTMIMVNVDDTNSYGVDFFHVQGGDDHLYSFHSQSDELTAVYGLKENMSELIYPTYVNEKGETIGSYAGKNVVFGADPGGYATPKYAPGYTWLKNVRTDNAPSKEFAVEFKVKDWRKRLPTEQDLRLRLTMVSDEPMKEVSFTTGMPPRTKSNNMNGELEYLLVRNTGINLDTTFTTVFEPYKAQEKYIASIAKVPMTRAEGEKPGLGDSFSAVKVTHVNGRVDYIMYSTNTDIEYLVDGKISFRGFAGVATVETTDAGEEIIYSYLNDGDMLTLKDVSQENTPVADYTGTVQSFTTELQTENRIVFTPDSGQNIDAALLKDKYVYVDNDGVQNGVYRICAAENLANGDVKLDLGDVTLVRSYRDALNKDFAYIYNISKGQSLRIPMSSTFDGAPVFAPQAEKSAAAGKKISFKVSATSPLGRTLTYSSEFLPRGASFDAATQTVSWTPDNTQIGANTIGVQVTDGTLVSTQYIEIEVYKSAGSVTGTDAPSTDTGSDTPSTDTPSTGTDSGTGSGAGGGGGSGGGGGGSSSGGGMSSGDTGNTGDDTTDDNPDVGDGVPDVSSEKFIDLGGYDWAKDAIYSLVDAGVVNGTSGNTYSPTANIKRADFAIMLVRAFGITEGEGENFVDVDPNKYYAEELRLAKSAGIVKGIGENKFNPEGEITRQDMMLMLVRALDAMGYELSEADLSVLAQFTDAASISDYAKDAVSRLVRDAIIAGANGRISPLAPATRAEVAVMLNRVLKVK